MLYQLSYFRIRENWLWAKMDSNHRRNYPADLQSAPFGHSGIRPCIRGKPPRLELDSQSINTWKMGVERALKKYIPNGTTAKGQRCPKFSLAAGSLSFPVCGCKVKQDFLLPQNFSDYFLCEFCIFFKITLSISDLPSLKLWRDFVFFSHARERYDFQFINKRGHKTTIEGLSDKFNPEFWNYAKLISGVLRYWKRTTSASSSIGRLASTGAFACGSSFFFSTATSTPE